VGEIGVDADRPVFPHSAAKVLVYSVLR